MIIINKEYLEDNEFLSIYYHFKNYNKKGENFYYRLYGMNKKTQAYDNIPQIGVVFYEVGDVYDYINTLDKKDYIKINIIRYNPLTNTDEVYDEVYLDYSFKLKRKKKNPI